MIRWADWMHVALICVVYPVHSFAVQNTSAAATIRSILWKWWACSPPGKVGHDHVWRSAWKMSPFWELPLHVSDSYPDGYSESSAWRGAFQHVLRRGQAHFEGGGGSPARLPQQLQCLVETEQHAALPGQRGLCKRTFGAVLRQGFGSAYCLFLQSPPDHWALFPRSHQSCCPSALSHHCGCSDGPSCH